MQKQAKAQQPFQMPPQPEPANIIPMQGHQMVALQERQMELEMAMQRRMIQMQERQHTLAMAIQHGLANPNQVISSSFALMTEDVNEVHTIERLSFTIGE